MKNKKSKFGKICATLALAGICGSLAGSTFITASAMSKVADVDEDYVYGATDGKYYTAFADNDEILAATRELNIEAEGEAAVLLKNDGTLPIKEFKRVSVFGVASDAYGYGGTGSGSSQLCEGGDIYSSWENQGVTINPKLKALYQKYSGGSPSAASAWSVPTYEDKELPLDYYTDSVKSTYGSYNDAAVIIINRLGGEGDDLQCGNVDGRYRPTGTNGALEHDKSEHYLELSYKEEQLIKHVEDSGVFDKIIVLFNAGNIIEFGELERDNKINAILNIGQTGDYSFDSVIKILKGEVNPSGRTVDIYTEDFTVDPVYQNFGNGSQTVASGTNTNFVVKTVEAGKEDVVTQSIPQIEYEEGIYLGYKYYETMHYQLGDSAPENTRIDITADATKEVLESKDINGTGDSYRAYTDADDWYNRNVVYPFGYGLSYSDFKWSEFNVTKTGEGKDMKFTATVKVTNKKGAPGKDVVEIYMSAPYTKDGVERSHVQLVGFAKTGIIKAGDSETVTIKFDAHDIAAYDWNDANKNNFRGYEIEAGDHVFSARRNSHTVGNDQTVTLDLAAVTLDTNELGNTVENVFKDSVKENAKYNFASVSPTMTIMSRGDMITTFPKAPTEAERTLTLTKSGDTLTPTETGTNPLLETVEGQVSNADLKITKKEMYDKYNYGFILGRDSDVNEDWVTSDVAVPAAWTQAASDKDKNGKTIVTPIRLADMMGLDPKGTQTVPATHRLGKTGGVFAGKTEKEAWVLFMNQLTYNELEVLTTTGFFKTAPIERIGKEEAVDADGPCTIGNQTKDGYQSARGSSNTRYWLSSQNIAMTWNTDLARRIGVLIGQEGMWNGYNGWYAPSMNTHRSPFSGRNFEYYSQDGVQGGLIAAALLQGSNQGGVYPYIKHFALNDQETNRNNMSVWADEQTIRENYLRVYKYAIVEGGGSGIMTGFNRIGTVNCTENYPLITKILRNEWGFDGHVVTDYQVGGVGDKNNNLEIYLRSGINIPLGDKTQSGGGEWDKTLRGGQGGVKVFKWDNEAGTYSATEFFTSDSTNADEKKLADIQYYYLRTRAQEILYTHVRSNAIDNGADFQLNIPTDTIKIPAGMQYTQALAIGYEGEGKAYVDYDIKIKESKLPANVTYNTKTNSFSGTARTKVGDKGTITITVVYDTWVKKDVTIPVEIVDPIVYTGDTAIAKGAAYTASVSQGYYSLTPDMGTPTQGVLNPWSGQTGDIYAKDGVYSIKVTANGLPEGLVMSEAGAITGTPTAAGKYPVTFTYEIKQQQTQSFWGNTLINHSNVKLTRTVDLTVGTVVSVKLGDNEVFTEAGGKLTKPADPAAPEGKQFDGWYKGDEKFDFDTAITESIVLTPKFVDIPDDIQFRVEGGKIQASINGGEWTDVISVSELKGDKGDKGEDGKDAVTPEDSGCGSALPVSSIALTLFGLMGAAIIVAVMRKRASKKND